MTVLSMVQLGAYVGLLILATAPMGSFMATVLGGGRTFLHGILGPVERWCYRLIGVDPDLDQTWLEYTKSLLAMSAAGFGVLYLILRFQSRLPLNPMSFGTAAAPAYAAPMTPDLAFNTAVSFVTNTNWQSYGGESTLSYFAQMAGLTVQNFLSAAAGIAVAAAVVRGFVRQESSGLGNFWADVVRSTIYILLPISTVVALFLCSQGVVQTLKPYAPAVTLENSPQLIALGPVASQEAVKMLGTNGGGFFNANSAHPFENPTPLANFVEMFLILLIPAGLTGMFGAMVSDRRQGWALFAVMAIFLVTGAVALQMIEQNGTPALTQAGIDVLPSEAQPGGNMEGKEVRFGIAATSLFAAITTAASCGAVNGMHDSFTPLGGLIPLFNIQTGEVIFGGVGSGLYGLLLFAVLAVFIAGLMVGRTPEYLGKKIEGREVKMAMLALIATSTVILVLAGVSGVIDFPRGGYINGAFGPPAGNVANASAHGLTEILYAYSSAAGNNGSAFAGLSTNTPWYNVTLALAMLVGRFLFIIPMLAIAGSLAAKRRVAITAGTFPTHGPLFVGLLTVAVLVIGALTFFPAWSLGPIVEHLLLNQGGLF